ncbi:MAG: hypothetical protein HND58_18040 [Planctomycetota bacterium]|nr:MAG: hypothetical protein HND58_18040 [Planctomycetota bacterium]
MTDVSDHLDDLRVILVGQTGLDSGLRSDPSVELVRARRWTRSVSWPTRSTRPTRAGRS